MLDEKDLQAIAQLVKQVVSDELEPINQRLDTIEKDIKGIKKTTKRIEGKMDAGFAYLSTSIDKVDRRMAYEKTMLKKSDMSIIEEMNHLHA